MGQKVSVWINMCKLDVALRQLEKGVPSDTEVLDEFIVSNRKIFR
jgi:hypothetical protein